RLTKENEKEGEKREEKGENKHTLNQSESNSDQERKEDLQEFHFGHKIEMKMKKNNNQIQMGDPIRKKLRWIPFLDVKQVLCHLVTIGSWEKRGQRALKRISQVKEELKMLTDLKADNQRLKDENGDLSRVISKLSKLNKKQ
ncbi:hypothetical protein EI555_016629, partial [Monodon monoceros]